MVMMDKKLLILGIIFMIFTILMTNCSNNPQELKITETPENLVLSPEISTSRTKEIEEIGTDTKNELTLLWIEPDLQGRISLNNFQSYFDEITNEKEKASFWVEKQTNMNLQGILLYENYYVLTVPFISRLNNLPFSQIVDIWKEKDEESSNYQIWINESSLGDLIEIFGEEPGDHVHISETEPTSCEDNTCLRLMDFSDVDPRWKIIQIDQQSLVDVDFNAATYPMVVRVWTNKNPQMNNKTVFETDVILSTNFDPNKLTSVLLTGTTALVRNTAFQIERYGFDFPAQNLKSLLGSVDILHISNEVPFYSSCPPAVPVRPEMRFCSDPGYVEVLKRLNVNVIELTGNHLLDWGPDAFLETISIYDNNGINYYGGGINQDQASMPYKIEHNGNKIAFIGCNVTGPDNNWATEDRPGALKCDLEDMEDEIKLLVSGGYNPIFTFQHFEFNTFRATQQMREDFWRMAKVGAVVVSGSQAHYPQGMDFVESSFIHYGLGNFFFDQMYTYWGMATIDIHYFYNNQYINTHQIAIINENFGQPRIMTTEEEDFLLDKLYSNSFYYLQEPQE